MANNRRFGWHSGSLACRDANIQGDLKIQGYLVFGDVSFGELAVKGRMSTGSIAGSAIDIDANYAYSQGHEFRWTISNWSGTGDSFDGQYIRAQNDVTNASGNIRGMQIYGVGNDVNTQSIWGILAYAYVKGTTAKTVGAMYAIQPELSWDASANTCTLSTEAICVRAKITGGKVDDYTKIHGVQVKAGDMNGASVIYGNGYWLLDDADLSGTVSWTIGFNLAADCTTGISLSGTNTTGIDIGTSDIGLTFTGGYTTTAIQLGTSGSKMILAANDDHVIDINVTSSATGASVRPIHMIHTMTGAGAVGGRAEFETTTAVILGGWCNALKSHMKFTGGTGEITGLASSIVCEMDLPNKTMTQGVYAVLELELNPGASSVSQQSPAGNYLCWQYMSVNTNKTDFSDKGYLFSIQGVTAGDTKLFSTNAGLTKKGALRILIDNTEYFIMLATSATS